VVKSGKKWDKMVNPDSKANPEPSTAPGDLIYTGQVIVHND